MFLIEVLPYNHSRLKLYYAKDVWQHILYWIDTQRQMWRFWFKHSVFPLYLLLHQDKIYEIKNTYLVNLVLWHVDNVHTINIFKRTITKCVLSISNSLRTSFPEQVVILLTFCWWESSSSKLIVTIFAPEISFYQKCVCHFLSRWLNWIHQKYRIHLCRRLKNNLLFLHTHNNCNLFNYKLKVDVVVLSFNTACDLCRMHVLRKCCHKQSLILFMKR